MDLKLSDFAAVAGSENSIGNITLSKKEGYEGLQKFGHHRHLTSLNTDNWVGDHRQTRAALFNAICREFDSNKLRTTERAVSFLDSVYQQLGLNGNDAVCNKALDRRTVRALVRATQIEVGSGVKSEKATACGKALASFLSGKTDGTKVFSGVLLELVKGVDTFQKAHVSDVWVNGEKPGESFHLEKSGNDVFVDCGGAGRIKLSLKELSEKPQLALVGKNDLPKDQRLEILNRAGKSCFSEFPGLKDLVGDSSPDVRFARELCEKSLLTMFGGEGLSANELRNVPARLMFCLAKSVAEGRMTLTDLRDTMGMILRDRFNSEETLEILDMYQKSADKDCVGYAEERKAAAEALKEQPKADVQKEEPKAAVKEEGGWLGKFGNLVASGLGSAVNALTGAAKGMKEKVEKAMPEIQAMIADVISDKRSFLADQHSAPGARLQVTLSDNKEALAKLLTYKAWILPELPESMAGTVKQLVSSLTDVLCQKARVKELPAQEDYIKGLLDKHLADPDMRKALAELDVQLDKASAEFCLRMQCKLNHSFSKVLNPASGADQSQVDTDHYDDLVDTIFDKVPGASKDAKEALLEKIDAFVDKFEKAGWSEKATQLIREGLEPVEEIKGVAEAERRIVAVMSKYETFAEIAEKAPKGFIAPGSEDLLPLNSMVCQFDEGDLPVEEVAKREKLKDDILKFIGKFAGLQSSKIVLGYLSLYCNTVKAGNVVFGFDALKAAIEGYMTALSPLADFIAELPPNDSRIKRFETGAMMIAANPIGFYMDLETLAKTLENMMGVLRGGYRQLGCADSVSNALMAIGNLLSDITDTVKIEAYENAIHGMNAAVNGSQSGVQNLVDFMESNGMKVDKNELMPNDRYPNSKVREARLNRSRDLLKKLGSGDDLDSGYGLFMTKVMKEYVKSMCVADQRAMLASGVRFMKNGQTNMQAMGAFLKGAGPIMQKMLQGLASMDVDKDFLSALSDMKSNLPDMADEVVKANLHDIVTRSNEAIRSIEMTKKLGAASVGQAFLCTVTRSDGTTQEVVVKMLRPEVEQRAEREKELFIRVAKQVPGMEKTFAGQLEGILNELDLRKEAENTKAGEIYDVGGMEVKSMKLLDVVAPTKYTMVVEKAPGTTVDRLIAKTEAKIEELVKAFYRTEVEKDSADNDVMVRKVNKDAFKDDPVGLANASCEAIVGLSRLYEETLVQQKRLVALASKWTAEGVFNGGFYHGDLHAGNIMVDDHFERDPNGKLLLEKNGGLTVIDYGNATRLTEGQQKNVIRMMTAASVKDTNVFMRNFAALMSPEGRRNFERPENWKANHDLIHNIFNLGSSGDSADRIFAVLQQLQLKGYELPPPIFKFSQCSIRLQGAIQDVNGLLSKIEKATLGFRKEIELPSGEDKMLDQADLHGQVLKDLFKNSDKSLGRSDSDFVELQKWVEEKLAVFRPPDPKEKAKKDDVPMLLPSEHLKEFFSSAVNVSKAPEICKAMMTKLGGLGKTHADTYGKLLKTVSKFTEDNAIKEAIKGFTDFDKKLFDKYGINIATFHQNQNTKQMSNFFTTLSDFAYGALKNQEISKYIHLERAFSGLFNGVGEDVRNFFEVYIDDLEEAIMSGKANQSADKVKKVIDKIGEELEVKIGAMKEIFDDEFDEKIRKVEESLSGNAELMNVLREFGELYDEAQRKLLSDFKNQLSPICHTNEKGEVDARLISDEEPSTFGEAVGTVIVSNAGKSVKKNGFGLSIEASWKLKYGETDPRV